jgi:predicted lipid-binding transport protein (Tim44 family)
LKVFLIALSMLLSGLTLSVLPSEAEARRLGGGRPAGMQRQLPPKQPDATPRQNPNAAAPVAGAAAAGKRSWMGPIAGLAAGLGIAALLSHFGLGEGLANLVTVLLLAAVAFIAVRWLLRRLAGAPAARGAPGELQYAGSGTPSSGGPGKRDLGTMERRTNAESVAAASAVGGHGTAAQPAGFDAAAFERIAKMIFIRLQAANDAGQVDDLRRFTTPELFASLRLDLQERGAALQQTDVVQLEAEVLDTAQEGGQWIASVRFHGLIREEAGDAAEPFDELWHLVKPVKGERDWAIAGITPYPA